MVQLEMNEKEAEVLREVLENYNKELDVEIHRTESIEFRQALQERGKALNKIVSRLQKAV